jgi:hypothetical protein
MESEEEFDFNQGEDMATIRSTLNRYKKASRPLFDFVPAVPNGRQLVEKRQDIEMTQVNDSQADDTVVFPFLLPLDSWKKPDVISEADSNIEGFSVTFFGSNGPQILANIK